MTYVEPLAAIELCDCECHNDDSFDTPLRWLVATGPPDDVKVEYLCTDCLLTAVSFNIGKSFTLTRIR